MKVFRFFISAFFILNFTSCIVTFKGVAPIQPNENIHVVKVKWNAFAGEPTIKKKMEQKIHEVMLPNKYVDYVIIYQSSTKLINGTRIYMIKYFKTADEKISFLNPSADVINKFNTVINTAGFNQRWAQLRTGSLLFDNGTDFSEVLKLLPELWAFPITMEITKDNSIKYKSIGIELTFSTNGNLTGFTRK
jgi:hypothetical protein